MFRRESQLCVTLDLALDSLMPATQFTQKQVCVVARVVYVSQNGRPAVLAGVVYDQIAVAEQALRDVGRNRHVLNITQRDVARRACDETFVNLYLGISQGVADHVALEMIVGRNQEQSERERQPNPPRNGNPWNQCEEGRQQYSAEGCGDVANLDEEYRGTRRKYRALDICRAFTARRRSWWWRNILWWTRDARRFRVDGGRTAASAEALARRDVSATIDTMHLFATSFAAAGQTHAGKQI